MYAYIIQCSDNIPCGGSDRHLIGSSILFRRIATHTTDNKGDGYFTVYYHGAEEKRDGIKRKEEEQQGAGGNSEAEDEDDVSDLEDAHTTSSPILDNMLLY